MSWCHLAISATVWASSCWNWNLTGFLEVIWGLRIHEHEVFIRCKLGKILISCSFHVLWKNIVLTLVHGFGVCFHDLVNIICRVKQNCILFEPIPSNSDKQLHEPLNLLDKSYNWNLNKNIKIHQSLFSRHFFFAHNPHLSIFPLLLRDGHPQAGLDSTLVVLHTTSKGELSSGGFTIGGWW